jgi:hypothetical protein
MFRFAGCPGGWTLVIEQLVILQRKRDLAPLWEYCLDLWSANYAEAPLDGSANLSGPSDGQRILRGGSWSHNPAICRSAFRDSIAPSYSGWQGRIGVRVVCTVWARDTCRTQASDLLLRSNAEKRFSAVWGQGALQAQLIA